MIRYLTLEEVLELHRLALEQAGGLAGVRDLGGLDSALAQPRMTFAGQQLYPSLAEKAAALGFSLGCNHPFVDGNKRMGFAAAYVFLAINGLTIVADPVEAFAFIDGLFRAGRFGFQALERWLRAHVR